MTITNISDVERELRAEIDRLKAELARMQGRELKLQFALAEQPAQQQEPVQQRFKVLRDQLQADINRPEGRWGIHGNSAVDNDYFTALEYVVQRIDDVLAAEQPAQQQEPEYIQLRHKEEDGFSPWGQPLDPKYRHDKWAAGVEMRLLYTSPQAQRKPLPPSDVVAMWHEARPAHAMNNAFDWYKRGVEDAEAAYGIKENT